MFFLFLFFHFASSVLCLAEKVDEHTKAAFFMNGPFVSFHLATRLLRFFFLFFFHFASFVLCMAEKVDGHTKAAILMSTGAFSLLLRCWCASFTLPVFCVFYYFDLLRFFMLLLYLYCWLVDQGIIYHNSWFTGYNNSRLMLTYFKRIHIFNSSRMYWNLI